MESKNIFYIITEGPFDVEILQKVLPENIVKNSKFVSSMGYSSAISKAKSLAVRLKNPIILLLDSDSQDDTETRYKKEQIEFIFKSLGRESQVKVILFQPEIEVIFFELEELRERLLNRGLLKDEPALSPPGKLIVDRENFIYELDDEDIRLLRQTTSLKRIIELYASMRLSS